jgi:hypothetical protein
MDKFAKPSTARMIGGKHLGRAADTAIKAVRRGEAVSDAVYAACIPLGLVQPSHGAEVYAIVSTVLEHGGEPLASMWDSFMELRSVLLSKIA